MVSFLGKKGKFVMEISIEKLWEYACSGNIEALKRYYKSEEGITDIRYYKFKAEHSLIMGAFRNNQFETVEYLLSIGESITNEEKEEINKELKRIELLKKLGG